MLLFYYFSNPIHNSQISSIAIDLAYGGGKDSSTASMFGGTIIRIDMSKGGKYVFGFLNNLEKDAQYKPWPRSLKQLLYPSWSLHTIARNMYTLIIVIDVLSIEGGSMIFQMNMMQEQQFPVRFGIVVRYKIDLYTNKTLLILHFATFKCSILCTQYMVHLISFTCS